MFTALSTFVQAAFVQAAFFHKRALPQGALALFLGASLGAYSLGAQASPLASDSLEASNEVSFLAVCEGRSQEGWETVNALLAEVGTTDCAIAQSQLLTITDLRLSGPDMAALPITCLLIDLPQYAHMGIIASAMPNLTHLDLSHHQVTDLAAIETLTNLEVLNLSDTQIADISPIAGLTQLTHLDISDNQIQDISAISSLTQLRAIDISHNPIANIRPLAVMYTPERDLEFIDLSNIALDRTTCPYQLGDACEDPNIGYEEGLRDYPY
ncbi:MAG: leucine-rich repeat domain-containing protein [Cyanobacteria bacterium J06643_4]